MLEQSRLYVRDLSTMAAARKTQLDTVLVDEHPSHDTTDQQRYKENYDLLKDLSRKCCRRVVVVVSGMVDLCWAVVCIKGDQNTYVNHNFFGISVFHMSTSVCHMSISVM